MAMPVQTWGSMGQFVAEQREFGTQCSEYLEKNEVNDVFATLLRQIIAEQPADPIAYIKEQLRKKPPLNVCIIGPPGIDRRSYCKKVAEEYNLVHISAGTVLEECLKKRQLKKDVEEAMQKGQLIDDDVIIPLIIAEVKAVKGKSGYVLDGFPRTKVQAEVLSKKEFGFGLDNILLLMAPDAAIKSGYAAKLGQNASPEEEELVYKRLQQYHRHVISIADTFKNVIRKVPIDLSVEPITNFDVIKNNIHCRAQSNAPLRSHRIAVVGPCCSGRTTQAKAVANQYGLVHVDLPVLIRRLQEERNQTIEDFPPEYMSDEDMCRIVGRRLNETDCLRKGWVLDGFPNTQAQAEFLRQAHLWPTRFVQLQVELDTVLARIQPRRVDPATCTIYYKSPASVAIRQRLVQLPHDLADAVRERYNTHQQNVFGAAATFTLVKSPIKADSDVDAVTSHIKQLIDIPLAHEITQ